LDDKIKIAYIGAKYDPFKNKKAYNHEYLTFYDTLTKMENHKHEIFPFFFDEVLNKYGKKMNQMLLEFIKEKSPDLCFFLVSYEMNKNTINEITKYTNTFNWFTDDTWQFEIFSKNYAPLFDYVGTTDIESIAKYHKIGYKNVIKTQWGYNHYKYKPISNENNYGTTFIGQKYGNRSELIDYIKSNGIKINCYGGGWENGRVSEHQMNVIFTNSEINLNFADSSYAPLHLEIPGIILRKDRLGKIHVREPVEWLPRTRLIFSKRVPQIKARVFEVPGCGGLLLTTNVNFIDQYYIPDKEIILFDNEEDMIEKINHIHNELDEKERKKIAVAGYKRSLSEHTYEKRFKEIFKKMNL
jgi:spore maturation protein CgeB